jgi:glycosyltransferase involved in cell wall biosynthesis
VTDGARRQRICILGKYPPIEGGVSTATYWIARALASRGHEVHVVTNADDVESPYRMRLTVTDSELLQPRFPNGGSVRVHHVQAFDPRAMAHIPVANPFVSRLAGLAADVIRRHRLEVVLAYYFEPYGMAGWFAAHATGRPLVLKHAGSDLDRLAAIPELAVAYKQLAREARAVLTTPSLMRRFAGMGASPTRIRRDPGRFSTSTPTQSTTDRRKPPIRRCRSSASTARSASPREPTT